jgi:hypothetical protein
MAMRLRAKVNAVLGPSTNYVGTIVDGQPVPVTQLPNPEWLEISEEGGAFYLYYLNADLECFADTWHQTLEGAKREALLGFGIKQEEWTEVKES